MPLGPFPAAFLLRAVVSPRSLPTSPDNTIDICPNLRASTRSSRQIAIPTPPAYEAVGISFASSCCPRLFDNLGRSLSGPSLPHRHRRCRWRQILRPHMDCEALATDLSGDDRAPGFFFWRSRKRQHVVLAVLHDTSHGSAFGALASLRHPG